MKVKQETPQRETPQAFKRRSHSNVKLRNAAGIETGVAHETRNSVA